MRPLRSVLVVLYQLASPHRVIQVEYHNFYHVGLHYRSIQCFDLSEYSVEKFRIFILVCKAEILNLLNSSRRRGCPMGEAFMSSPVSVEDSAVCIKDYRVVEKKTLSKGIRNHVDVGEKCAWIPF